MATVQFSGVLPSFAHLGQQAIADAWREAIQTPARYVLPSIPALFVHCVDVFAVYQSSLTMLLCKMQLPMC
jgi:hypothetical protein